MPLLDQDGGTPSVCVGALKMKDLWSDGSYWGPSLLTHLVPISSFPLVIVPEAAAIHCPRSPAQGEAECQPYPLSKYRGFGPRGTWPCGSTVWYHKVSSWEGGMQTDIRQLWFYQLCYSSSLVKYYRVCF